MMAVTAVMVKYISVVAAAASAPENSFLDTAARACERK